MTQFKIGEIQTLTMQRLSDFGAYLTGSDDLECVLLPKKQVPEDLKPGDKIEVFIYKDSSDRLIATTRRPKLLKGQFALLRVKTATKIGAFLDWGLEKDLFLPFKEQEYPVSSGDNVPVYLYIDKSERLAATMRIYDFLSPDTGHEFSKEDAFSGIVYRTQRDIGAFTAVIPKNEQENEAFSKLYFGLIPSNTLFTMLKPGDIVNGSILRVRNDGKLDIRIRDKSYKMLDADGEAILRKIDEFDGELPFSDNVSPEIIKRELKMSKNSFKKALGHLYKEGKVEIRENSVVKK